MSGMRVFSIYNSASQSGTDVEESRRVQKESSLSQDGGLSGLDRGSLRLCLLKNCALQRAFFSLLVWFLAS